MLSFRGGILLDDLYAYQATHDATNPRVVVSTTAIAPVSTAFLVTIEFFNGLTGAPETVYGFTSVSQITGVNCVLSAFTALSGSEYTVTITPDWAGTVSISVAAGACVDAAGNANTAGSMDVTIAYYSTNTVSITPTVGPTELFANPGEPFTFTADNPTGWTVTGEVGHDPEVTERASGGAHADAVGVGGACNIYSTATNYAPILSQAVLTVGTWVQRSVKISRKVAGLAIAAQTGGANYVILNGVATYTWTERVTATEAIIYPGLAPYDLTLDSHSAKILSTTDLLFTHSLAYGDFSITFTIPTAFYQAGVKFNYQDANNYNCINYNRIDGKVYLLKCVTGTTTTIGSWSAAYSAGKVLTARRHIDGTIDVIYNAATLASGIATTGLTGLQAGPFLTNSAGVTISNYTWDARSAT